MKIDAVSTASLSRPPPFSRRSSTIPLAPCLSSLSTAARTSWLESVVKLEKTTHPNLPALVVTILEATTGVSISARSSVLSNRLPSRSIVSVTSVPGSPLIRLVP